VEEPAEKRRATYAGEKVRKLAVQGTKRGEVGGRIEKEIRAHHRKRALLSHWRKEKGMLTSIIGRGGTRTYFQKIPKGKVEVNKGDVEFSHLKIENSVDQDHEGALDRKNET